MKEVMGRARLFVALNQAGLSTLADDMQAGKSDLVLSFGGWLRIQSVLEQLHGSRSGNGLALRFGRALFPEMMRRFGEQAGLLDPRFRLMPPRAKIHAGLLALAALLKQQAGLETRLDETTASYQWVPMDFSRCTPADQAMCYLLVGLLQEFLYWASGGKYYNIEESACVLLIDKQAID